jgi:hypothetical protein
MCASRSFLSAPYPKERRVMASFFMGAASGCAAYFFSRAGRQQPEGVLSLAGKRLWRAA